MSFSSFFHPKSVAVVGASQNSEKLGSVILQNIQDAGFKGDVLAVNPKHGGERILGVKTIAKVSDHTKAFDLVIVVIPSKFVEAVIDDCILNKTKSIIIVSAGFKEVGNTELETQIAQKCAKHEIALLGPNCLGAIFPHAGLNASFADGYPNKGNICFVSQSGAFCTAMLDWATEKGLGFSHFISLGNKAGISEIDILEQLADDPKVEIFAFYLESNVEGEHFLNLIEKVSTKKPVVILEPGRSAKAAAASSSHTGSLAPNFKVLETAYAQYGAIQVFSMRDMFSILELLSTHAHKDFGSKIAIITNAGGAGVLSTDLSEANHLLLESPHPETLVQLEKVLPAEAGLTNPIDIIGDARADRYRSALEVLSKDKNIDQILVLLTPQRTTEIEETAKIIAEFAEQSDKNIVASFIGGERVKSGVTYLESHGVTHFDFPADGLKVMGLLSKYQRFQESIKSRRNPLSIITPEKSEIEQLIEKSQEQKLKSLPQPLVDKILDLYELDRPASQNFTAYNEALKFFQSINGKVVLKISSPDALHKTDLKGVFLNVDTEEKFQSSWENLEQSIEISEFKNASIQVQEQIEKSTEVILGINTDPTFGKVMLFGSGGIYTEVMQDTAIGLIPVRSFSGLLNQTKIGEILHGVRGEEPQAVEALIETMQRVEQLVIDFPMISSIDANPVLVTKDRAVCVDFKILL